MDYVNLGASGLKVSRVALGCMSFGDPGRGAHEWTLDEDAALPLLHHALDSGINFLDTANVYSLGDSERIVGAAVAKLGIRDDVVIATKVYEPLTSGPLAGGLSAVAIKREVEASLRRLQVDHIDLYIAHRWDSDTSPEETMRAFDDVVRAGKVRYIGASSMPTWRFVLAQETARQHGWSRFVSMQNHYNLLHREQELEMLPYCAASGVGVTPWSPLARGLLTRRPGDLTARHATDAVLERFYGRAEEPVQRCLAALAAVAGEHDVPLAQIAMAWLFRQPSVVAPVVGATASGHIDDAVAATNIELSDDDVALLSAAAPPVYAPELI